MDRKNVVAQVAEKMLEDPSKVLDMFNATLQTPQTMTQPVTEAIGESLRESLNLMVRQQIVGLQGKREETRNRIARKIADKSVGMVCKNRQMLHALGSKRILDLCALSGERAGIQCQRMLESEAQPGKKEALQAILIASGAPQEAAADPDSMEAAVYAATQYVIFNSPVMKRHWASRSRKGADARKLLQDAMNTAQMVATIVALGNLTARAL